ncbi:MAG: hypothetical protein ACI8WT_001801 [Clostridium sp.]|jgi:hypothetical protein
MLDEIKELEQQLLNNLDIQAEHIKEQKLMLEEMSRILKGLK